MDSGYNNLLKWSVDNSNTEGRDTNSPQQLDTRGFDQAALARLLGGPSDADRMREAMTAIQSPEVDLDNKLIAFDNFEQLIESLDNANNMGQLGLWVPLIEQLDNAESELQRMAAWCIGTAVQNNVQAQERCLTAGAIPKLLGLALSKDIPTATRKKAVYALSSVVRNYQPGLDAMISDLPSKYRGEDSLDANDMEAVDVVIDRLRKAASDSA